MTHANKSAIFVAILAAGQSRRFGRPKQLTEVGGIALVRRARDAAAALAGERTLLVLGHEWEAVAAACGPDAGFFLINEDYRKGMGSSIAAATRSLSASAEAILFMLADQPYVTAEHLRTLIDGWSGSANEIVVSRFDASRGPPALLPSRAFAELVKLDGDEGAKRLFDDARFRIREIECPAAAIDIDKPEDMPADNA